MLTKNINFHNFSCKKKNTVKNIFNQIKKNYFLGKEKLLLSLSDQYKYSFDVKKISKFKRFSIYRIIGMGGSVLGAEAIYNFITILIIIINLVILIMIIKSNDIKAYFLMFILGG